MWQLATAFGTTLLAAASAMGWQCETNWARFNNTAPESENFSGVQWEPTTGSLVYLRDDQVVFEWNGSAWVTYTTITGGSINLKAGCWDPDRARIVAPSSSGVLVEWNGASHSFDTRPNSSGITGYVEGLAYDTRRHRMLAIATQNDADRTLALFEESPGGWVRQTAIPRFSRWYVDGFVYDPITDRVLLLGGDTQSPPITYVPMRLYAYKTAATAGAGSWSQLPLEERPSLSGSTTVIDPQHGLMVIGGYERYRDYRYFGLGQRDRYNNLNEGIATYNPATGQLRDGLDWLPTLWSPLAGSSNPRHGRFDSAVARNAADGRLVVVGGATDGYTFTPDDGYVHHEVNWNDTLFAGARPSLPVFTLQPQARSYCTNGLGGTASGRLQSLASSCDGSLLHFRWFKWDPSAGTYVATPGETQNAFWPADDVLRESDSGTYRVLAWNSYGITWSDEVVLTVSDPVVMLSSPQWPDDTCPGNSVVIVAPQALGTSLTLTLQKQVGDVGAWVDVMNVSPLQAIVLNNMQNADSGVYRFRASNACNEVVSASHRIQVGASIEGPLTILGQVEPCQSIVIRPLLGSVHGRGELSYRWFKDGVPLVDDSHISGSTEFSLSISSLSFGDTGTYELRVSDGVCLYPAVATKRLDLPEPAATYVKRDPTGASPSARAGHAMAYDASRGVVVLFGGIGAGTGGQDAVLDDTWEFDGTHWTQRTPVHSPGPVHSHAMVYDSTRGRVVLFGGNHSPVCPSCSPLAQLWEWDGQDWTLIPATGPADVLATNPAMCYDSVSRRIVVYTGLNSSITLYQGETWLFDPAAVAWTRIGTAGPGTAYGYPAMYFDAATGRRMMYVYGSVPPDVTPAVPALWTWAAGSWQIADWDPSGNWQYNQQQFPWCSNSSGTWIYNPLRKSGESGLMTVIPVGGGGYYNGTYTSLGTTGTTIRRAIDNGFGLSNSCEVWDSRRSCAVIFGGKDLYPGHPHYGRPVSTLYERHFRSAPYILDEPEDVPLVTGESLSFRVVAAGEPMLSYRWRHNGTPMFDDVRTSGSFTPSLRIINAGPADSGVYDCVVTNNCGPVVSRAAHAGSDCRADFDGDGFVDGFDYDAYVACFEGAACPPGKDADFDGDGFVDGFDYDTFVATFENGCL